jgi:hypothetical protein
MKLMLELPLEVEVVLGVLADRVEDAASREAELAGVPRHGDVREARDDPVVEPPEPAQEHGLVAASRLAVDDVVALLPAADELRDELGRILEVGLDQDRRVAGRVQETEVDRAVRPDVPREAHRLHVRMLRAELLQELERAVLRAVVRIDVLEVVAVAERLDRGADALEVIVDVQLLVVTGRDDRDPLAGVHGLSM